MSYPFITCSGDYEPVRFVVPPPPPLLAGSYVTDGRCLFEVVEQLGCSTDVLLLEDSASGELSLISRPSLNAAPFQRVGPLRRRKLVLSVPSPRVPASQAAEAAAAWPEIALSLPFDNPLAGRSTSSTTTRPTKEDSP